MGADVLTRASSRVSRAPVDGSQDTLEVTENAVMVGKITLSSGAIATAIVSEASTEAHTRWRESISSCWRVIVP